METRGDRGGGGGGGGEEDHLLSCSWGRSDMIVDLAGCVGGSKYEVAHSSQVSAHTTATSIINYKPSGQLWK